MLGRPLLRPGVNRSSADATHWYEVTPTSLPTFSAVCWYAGKALFDWHGGRVPFGLVMGANGGTAIEMFMPAASVAACGTPESCHQNVSDYGQFYNEIIGRLDAYRVGAIVWDQAEADLSCNHTNIYPCLEQVGP
jgi:hypothetical protein